MASVKVMGRLLRGSILTFNNMQRVVQALNMCIYIYTVYIYNYVNTIED